jgi:hypothetical protein
MDCAASILLRISREEVSLFPDAGNGADAESQLFAASFGVDGKQFVHLSHNRGCNRISWI